MCVVAVNVLQVCSTSWVPSWTSARTPRSTSSTSRRRARLGRWRRWSASAARAAATTRSASRTFSRYSGNVQSKRLKWMALGTDYEYPHRRSIHLSKLCTLYIVSQQDQTNDIHLHRLSTRVSMWVGLTAYLLLIAVVVPSIKACSHHMNWIQLQFVNSGLNSRIGNTCVQNLLSTQCPSFTAANQVLTEWRVWPMKALRNWVDLL